VHPIVQIRELGDRRSGRRRRRLKLDRADVELEHLLPARGRESSCRRELLAAGSRKDVGRGFSSPRHAQVGLGPVEQVAAEALPFPVRPDDDPQLRSTRGCYLPP
jgi:hypothetical protein